MGRTIVEAKGVCKSYHLGRVEIPVLKDVDVTVRAGDFVAVMGPSGCGKTTLLNCLSGLDEVDAGSIRIDGADLAKLGDRARTRHRAKRMGFVFQAFNLLPVLSATQNVQMPLLLSGVSRKDARRRAEAALESVGLADRGRHKPTELSGGQQQRVAIARALVNDPAILWADEPTGNLDSSTGEEVLGLMCDLNRERGVTLVVVTHDPRVAEAAHRTVRMDSGRVVSGDGPRRFEVMGR